MRELLILVTLAVSSVGWAQEQPDKRPTLPDERSLSVAVDSDALQRQYDALAAMSLRTLEYSRQGPIQSIDGDTNIVVPVSIRGLKKGDSGAAVLPLVKDVLLAAGTETLSVTENYLVDDNTRNLSFTQNVHGIPVIRGVVSLEIDELSRRVTELVALFLPERNLPTKARLSAAEAEQVVPHALNLAEDFRVKQIEIVDGTYLGYFVNPTENSPPTLVWVVRATLDDDESVEFLVDAITGDVLLRTQLTHSLSRTIYDVNNNNVAFPNVPNQYKLTEAQIATNTTASLADVNTAKANAAMLLRFPTAAGNLPQTLKLIVDWPFSPKNAKQELINGIDYIRFSGETSTTYSFAQPINIVAHEFAHGFSDGEVGPNWNVSDDQGGALKEGFSDIMGAVVDIVEGASSAFSSPTWVAGRGTVKSDVTRGLRSMMFPKGDPRATYTVSAVDWFPDRIRGWGLGHHSNSTILSHAYYLLVFGGTHSRASDPSIPDITVVGQGESKARRIFMRAWQDSSMNSQPSFPKMKAAAIGAASSLFPGSGADSAARNAFEAVGICDVANSAPGQVSLTSLGDLLCAGRFHPTWGLIAGATQYYAEVAPATVGFAFGSPVTNVDGNTNQCMFQVTQPSLFRIQACNDCGCGPWSDTHYLNYWSPCP